MRYVNVSQMEKWNCNHTATAKYKATKTEDFPARKMDYSRADSRRALAASRHFAVLVSISVAISFVKLSLTKTGPTSAEFSKLPRQLRPTKFSAGLAELCATWTVERIVSCLPVTITRLRDGTARRYAEQLVVANLPVTMSHDTETGHVNRRGHSGNSVVPSALSFHGTLRRGELIEPKDQRGSVRPALSSAATTCASETDGWFAKNINSSSDNFAPRPLRVRENVANLAFMLTPPAYDGLGATIDNLIVFLSALVLALNLRQKLRLG